MKGAYCLNCREEGPDLTVLPDRALPIAMVAAVTFVCGRCGVRWRWTVTYSPTEPPQYSNPRKEPSA